MLSCENGDIPVFLLLFPLATIRRSDHIKLLTFGLLFRFVPLMCFCGRKISIESYLMNVHRGVQVIVGISVIQVIPDVYLHYTILWTLENRP